VSSKPPPRSSFDNLIAFMIGRRHNRLYREMLMLYGIDIPNQVEIGDNLALIHRGRGVLVSRFVTIGDRVQLYPRATIGRSDIYNDGRLERITIGDDSILGVGSIVLGGSGARVLGQGTVLGANAVLNQDTNPWEIWAGNPARQVGLRKPVTS
jgi:serine O-acetyltransferase